MEAAKTFERNGQRYRPGDPLPDDLDAVTRAHYLRYGMIRERGTPAPSEHKPAGPARSPRTPKPKQAETPAPNQTATQAAATISQDAGGQQAGGLLLTGESGAELEATGQAAESSADPSDAPAAAPVET